MKKKHRRTVRKFCALALTMSLALPQNSGIVFAETGNDGNAGTSPDETKLTKEEVEALYQNVSYKRGSVHDPSIIVNGTGDSREYYVFGSHMGVAKTEDLMNWSTTDISDEKTDNAYFGVQNQDGTVTKVSYEEAFKQNALTGETTLYKQDGTPYTVNFGDYDLNAWITPNAVKGDMWAPDVIYNTEMKKWCMYLSLNGANWNSVILLLTADQIEGPYVYQAPIVFTGFQSSNNGKTGGYKNTDLELVLGELDSLPARYDQGNSWGTYWPHGIDPFVTYDKNGKLWLGYGSWSGGIYVLELDEKTGLRDYSVTYESDYETKGASVTTDAYFGKKIAGGYYVSGEGPYVEQIGDYYYLFMSYGFYSPTGGYNMRIVRSESVDGPYLDVAGNNAIYTSRIDNYRNTSRGLQLMGNYKWNTMSVAEAAQGHNSAFVDADGNAYVIYHTKFDDGTAGHQLRVHQLYMNEDGWIVAAPYEYAGETVNDETIANISIPNEDIIGDYDLILHQYNNPKAKDDGTVEANMDVVKPADVTLNADGTISGTYTGTWAETEGTAYATITINGTKYKGVFTKQTIDGTNAKTICFSAVNDSNVCVWGSKKLADDVIVAYNAANPQEKIPVSTSTNLTIGTVGEFGASISWESSNTSVLSNDGTITRQAADTKVTLTKTIAKGSYSYSEDYEITIIGTGTENAGQMSFTSAVSNDTLMKVPSVSANTGVSITFTVSDVESDWVPMFITDNGEHVYLSVLNYSNENIFEASGIMSSEAVEAGYAPWTIFTGTGTHKVTISYNVDGSIGFYKDDVLMLTYAADTAIGSSTVAALSKAMALAVRNGQLNVAYNMTDIRIDYALDYDGTVQDTSKYLYYQDYENVSDASTVWTSTDAQNCLTISNNGEHGNYLYYNTTLQLYP